MLRRLEPFTLGLVLLCVAWTGLSWALGWTEVQAGALNRARLWAGDYGRAFTTILLHGGGWHLLLNGLSLYFVGQAVARGCGRGMLLACVLLGSWAGLGASLLRELPGDPWRVGISGGVFALLGLVLAVEWAWTDSWRSFLRQRNTRLVLFFLALNVGLAVWFEIRYPGLIDHLGHAGGLASGLLFGLAWYARLQRVRRVPGAVAAVLLGLGPLALAAHPFWNADFHLHRARAAEARGDAKAAGDAYAQVLRRRPGDPEAGAHLAILSDDPAVLAGLRSGTPGQNAMVAAAHLELARRRLASDPERARDLMTRALALPGLPEMWLEFGHAALAAGREDLARPALERSLPGLPGSVQWQAAAPLLAACAKEVLEEGLAPEERLRRALHAASVAMAAAGGLGASSPLDEARREELEHDVALLGAQVIATAMSPNAAPTDDLRPLAAAMSGLYRRLADNTASARTAAYRLQAARLLAWEQQGRETTEEEREELHGLFRAALGDARDFGNPQVEAAAEAWFRQRGIEVPKRELAGPPGGG